MTPPPDIARIEAAWRQALNELGAGGGALVLVHGDRSWALAHGDAQPGRPVTADTPFHWCSCSKTVAAAVFSRLVLEGVAEWDATVRATVPEFAFADPWVGRHCTYRDLAAMRLGLGRGGIAEWGIDQRLAKGARLGRAAHMAWDAGFREGFAYSNLCYIALALAAERLAGRPYPELARDWIFAPLEMRGAVSAGFGVAAPPEAASPYLPIGGVPTPVRELTGPNSEGSARVYGSGHDALCWIRFLLEALAGSDAGPLPARSVAAMATPWALMREADPRHSPDGAPWCAYGMGLFLTTLHGRPLYRHGGGGRGWRHMLLLAPHARAGVMLMASAEHPGVEGLALEILEALAGAAPRDRRGLCTQVATEAADAAQRTARARLAAVAGPAIAPSPGRYANPLTGAVQVDADAAGLRIRFADAPDFSARLVAAEDGFHALEFDEPALARQPLDPPFLLRTSGTALETTYFGHLERIE